MRRLHSGTCRFRSISRVRLAGQEVSEKICGSLVPIAPVRCTRALGHKGGGHGMKVRGKVGTRALRSSHRYGIPLPMSRRVGVEAQILRPQKERGKRRSKGGALFEALRFPFLWQVPQKHKRESPDCPDCRESGINVRKSNERLRLSCSYPTYPRTNRRQFTVTVWGLSRHVDPNGNGTHIRARAALLCEIKTNPLYSRAQSTFRSDDWPFHFSELIKRETWIPAAD
jgi:hypothetical protein